MKFSILIPVYNAEKYLDECVQNIMAQTYRDFEAIFINDGSTDRTAEICSAYAASFPRHISVIHQENSKQLIARVRGARSAKGEYCVFMDVDDLFRKQSLAMMATVIEHYDHPDILMFPYIEEGDEPRLVGQMKNGNYYYAEDDIPGLRKAFFRDEMPVTVWTKAIKREVLLTSFYDEERYSGIMYSEDRLQLLWVLDNIETAAYCNVPMYHHFIHPGSVTRNYSVDRIGKLNYSVLYDEEKYFAEQWRLEGEEWILRIKAHYAYRVGKVFSRFYMNASPEERKKVLDYPWEKYIPADISHEDIRDNPYLTDTQKQLFEWIYSKNNDKLKSFFTKRKLYLYARGVKRKYIHPKKK